MLGGWLMHRLRITRPDLVGSTTSTIAISDKASNTCRGSSPSPARGNSRPESSRARSQKANQDVGLHSIFFLIRPGGSQVGLVNVKRARLRQLDVGRHRFPDSNPSRCCAARNSLAQARPLSPGFHFDHRRRAKPPASASTFTRTALLLAVPPSNRPRVWRSSPASVSSSGNWSESFRAFFNPLLKRSCMACSLARRSALRHRMKTSWPPGAAVIRTSSPACTSRQSRSATPVRTCAVSSLPSLRCSAGRLRAENSTCLARHPASMTQIRLAAIEPSMCSTISSALASCDCRRRSRSQRHAAAAHTRAMLPACSPPMVARIAP